MTTRLSLSMGRIAFSSSSMQASTSSLSTWLPTAVWQFSTLVRIQSHVTLWQKFPAACILNYLGNSIPILCVMVICFILWCLKLACDGPHIKPRQFFFCMGFIGAQHILTYGCFHILRQRSVVLWLLGMESLWSAKSETPFSSLQEKTKLLALSLGRTGVCFEIAIGTNMYQWIWYFSESSRRVLGKGGGEQPCFWDCSREIYNEHERGTGALYLV